MGLGIAPLNFKIVLESTPLKSRILVRRLAVPRACGGCPRTPSLAAETACSTPISVLRFWISEGGFYSSRILIWRRNCHVHREFPGYSLAAEMACSKSQGKTWLRTDGVNTNGAAANVMSFDRLGKKESRLTGLPKRSLCQQI